jgi:hypothetical protein
LMMMWLIVGWPPCFNWMFMNGSILYCLIVLLKSKFQILNKNLLWWTGTLIIEFKVQSANHFTPRDENII